MKIPTPLTEGVLLKRYKRFLTDVELTDGRIVTAHTPNTGSMKQCAVPGHRVLVSHTDDPKRKLPWTLERIEVNGFWVDTHTHRANRVVEEALRNGHVHGLEGYHVRPEFPFGNSRIDFLLESATERVLVEVKNVTLCEGHVALFPDAVTVRGQKHLKELATSVAHGYRPVIFFLVQRGEATSFSPADEIDPEYGRLLREVTSQGVQALAYRTSVTEEETMLDRSLPVILEE